MDWKEKVCIITGATSGIGRETALAIALKGMRLVLPVRSMEKGIQLKQEIFERTGNNQVYLHECDLSSMDSIRKFCDAFQKDFQQLHILINNAGTLQTRQRQSKDGIELTFAVNHLSGFLMTNLLLDSLKACTASRIINVSSIAHLGGWIRFGDIERKKGWTPLGAYAQSKLANILFTRKLAKKLENCGVTVNALHPGVVRSNLYNKLPSLIVPFFKWFMISSQKGAQTTIYLALSPEVEKVSGKYFVNKRIRKTSRQAMNDQKADKLWKISCLYTGLPLIAPSYGKTA